MVGGCVEGWDVGSWGWGRGLVSGGFFWGVGVGMVGGGIYLPRNPAMLEQGFISTPLMV